MIKNLQKRFVRLSMAVVTVLLLVFVASVNILTAVNSYREAKQKLDAIDGMIRTTSSDVNMPQDQSDSAFDNAPGGERRPGDNRLVPPQKPEEKNEEQESQPAEETGEETLTDGEIPTESETSDENETETLSESKDEETGRQFGLPKEPKVFGISEDDAFAARYFRVKISESGKILDVDVSSISSVSESEAKTFAAEVIEKDKSSGIYSHFLYKVGTGKNSDVKTGVFLDVSSEINDSVMWLIFSFASALILWLAMFLILRKSSSKAIQPYAENAEKQKRFVTDAGHEIKTPLAVIRANVEAMELYNGENKWSNNIKSQVDRLTGLMQELLELSRTEQSEITAALEKINLTELSLKMTQSFDELAVSDGKKIITDIAQGVTVSSNVRMLERILDVLLDNALKYSSDESEIKYALKHDKKSTQITIENKCDKLPDCDSEKLFDRFYRADSSRNSSGYGIGLASARASAEAIGCKLTAEYQGKDTILFRLKFH